MFALLQVDLGRFNAVSKNARTDNLAHPCWALIMCQAKSQQIEPHNVLVPSSGLAPWAKAPLALHARCPTCSGLLAWNNRHAVVQLVRRSALHCRRVRCTAVVGEPQRPQTACAFELVGSASYKQFADLRLLCLLKWQSLSPLKWGKRATQQLRLSQRWPRYQLIGRKHGTQQRSHGF